MEKKSKIPKEEEELITVQEAATLKGVSKTRIHQWINEGRLKKEVRYGRSVVSKSEVMSIEPLPGGRPRKIKSETKS